MFAMGGHDDRASGSLRLSRLNLAIRPWQLMTKVAGDALSSTPVYFFPSFVSGAQPFTDVFWISPGLFQPTTEKQ
jgi:hypothetical protein